MTRRGTTNGNDRGSAESRRRRRAWVIETYASDVEGYARCFRCGDLLFNSDDQEEEVSVVFVNGEVAYPLTIDRIIPGCRGGTYKRNNIRPACGGCNSSLGGKTRRAA